MKAFIESGGLLRFRNQDQGGVHVFSGIPNRAFVLCAEAFGGYS
jgi:Zn-dependent metalloprotease